MMCPVIVCGKREAFAQGTEQFTRMCARDERNCARAVMTGLATKKSIPPPGRIDCFRRRSSSHGGPVTSRAMTGGMSAI